MFPLPETKRLLVVAAVLILIAAGGIGLFYLQIDQTIAEWQELNNDLVFETERKEKLRSVQNVVDDTATHREQLTAYFIGSNGVAGYINEVEDLANQADVNLEIDSVGVNSLSNSKFQKNNKSQQKSESDTDSADDAASEKQVVSSSPVLERVVLELSVKDAGWSNTFRLLQLLEAYPKAHRIIEFSISQGQEGEISDWNSRFVVHALKITSDNNESGS